MEYVLYNPTIESLITISMEDGDFLVRGDAELIPFFEEALQKPFSYFGPMGYESIDLTERPELLPIFLLQYADQWEISPDIEG